MRARESAPQREKLPSQHGNGSSPCDPREGEDLDAYISELVAAAPPLTAEQRDTLALLLRRPRPRQGKRQVGAAATG